MNSGKEECEESVKFQRLLLTVIPVAVLLAQSPKENAGWVTLFDGKTLSGWHSEGDARWKVEGASRQA